MQAFRRLGWVLLTATVTIGDRAAAQFDLGAGRLRRRVLYVMLPLLAAVAVGSGVLAYTGSIAGTLAFLGGRDFIVDPTTVDVGVGRDGEHAVAELQVQNLACRPLEVLGVVPDCPCIRIIESPRQIAPRSVGVVKVEVAFTGRPGKFQQAIIVYCSSPGQFRVAVPVRGRVGT